MKQYFMLRISALLCLCAFSLGSNAQMGIGTTTPDSSSILDVYSSNKGLLVPRIALTATNVAAPVNNPATSLMVYNTATAGTPPNNVMPGFYYWTGSRWYPVVNKGTNFGDMQYWNGTQWVAIPAGSQGQTLTWCSGKPQWGPCVPISLSLNPVNNQYEGFITSYYSTNWTVADQLSIGSWTFSGTPYSDRSLLRFDYSGLPPTAVIDSAKLLLYADPTPINGNLVDAHFGTANAFYIQRITNTWTSPSAFTWSTPPTSTTVNQVTIPQSTSSFQDCVANVTEIVKDQISNGNNGFLMRLVTEQYYNIRQYVSSKNTDTTRHPKLLIYFH
jgi:hypothetical protein